MARKSSSTKSSRSKSTNARGRNRRTSRNQPTQTRSGEKPENMPENMRDEAE
ncbi:MAG TPA: hypothetical protein VG322_14250 [Candidatus Acidoferrales bacterium]|jgi:hypothetical protein|nr:hypothetical protein [Candidatus Acidoferrales bacterium]